MQRIGEAEWESDGILPVSFAPLINCKEDSKDLLEQFIEIRKFIYLLCTSVQNAATRVVMLQVKSSLGLDQYLI